MPDSKPKPRTASPARLPILKHLPPPSPLNMKRRPRSVRVPTPSVNFADSRGRSQCASHVARARRKLPPCVRRTYLTPIPRPRLLLAHEIGVGGPTRRHLKVCAPDNDRSEEPTSELQSL